MESIRTKIVCTLGPATDKEGVVAAMIAAGMRVARFNFSHGSIEDHMRRARLVREVSAAAKVDVALLQDLQGPKVRLGRFPGGGVRLETGDPFTLSTVEEMGSNLGSSVDYPNLAADVGPGAVLLLADGAVRLSVEERGANYLRCRVESGGYIADRQGVNVPGHELKIPALTSKDREDLAQGAKIGFDYLALSFVQRPGDVTAAKALLAEHHSGARVLAKIEKPLAVERFQEILAVSDGIMVARGDLGVEIEAARLPIIQKQLIAQCNDAGKPVITATQMLQSMIKDAQATRAEVSDVANAILDGSDAVMLSGETSAGQFPIEAVLTLRDVALATESSEAYRNTLRAHRVRSTGSVQDACAHAACGLAHDINAAAIVCLTKGGTTAKAVSANHPYTPIVAAAPDSSVRRVLALYRGVTPVTVAFPAGADTDQIVNAVLVQAKRESWFPQGGTLVFTAGLPFDRTGGTNLIRIESI